MYIFIRYHVVQSRPDLNPFKRAHGIYIIVMGLLQTCRKSGLFHTQGTLPFVFNFIGFDFDTQFFSFFLYIHLQYIRKRK